MSTDPTTSLRLRPISAACALVLGGDTIKSAGMDLVVDVSGGLVHFLLPFGSSEAGLNYGFRLTFTPNQLGELMDSLVEASDLVTS